MPQTGLGGSGHSGGCPLWLGPQSSVSAQQRIGRRCCKRASVKLGGVPQCSREVEHCGTLGTPAPFQNSVEWCGMMWNGCALMVPWLCLDNLSPPVTACQP